MNHADANQFSVDPVQAKRLNSLIEHLAGCCQERMLRESENFGLLPAEMRCLMQFKNKRYLTAKDLGQSLELAKSRISKIVDGLIAKDVLERWTDPKDGRFRLLNLTEQGRASLDQIEAYEQKAHAMILARFEPELREAVLASLEQLTAAMDQVKEELCQD